MTLSVMQPYLFPYIGYFQLLKACDRFVFYDDVNYIRQGWINRNRILVGGQPWLFSVPLDNPSSFRPIREVHVHPRLYPGWRAKFLRTFTQNYSKTPGFPFVMDTLQVVLAPEGGPINVMAANSIRLVWNYLGLSHDWVDSSRNYQNGSLSGQDRVLDICGREGADAYLNLPGGSELYSAASFAAARVRLSFLKPMLVPYPQNSREFVPSLSIVDVLCHNSRSAVVDMLGAYEVV